MNLREAFGDDYDIIVHNHWEFDWPDALALSSAIEPMRPMLVAQYRRKTILPDRVVR